MDLKTFTLAINQLAQEKELSKEKVLEIAEQAIAAAYKKEYGDKNQKIVADLDLDKGTVKFWQVKKVVTEDQLVSEEEKKKMREEENDDENKIVFNPERHILLKEAQKKNPDIKPGDDFKILLESKYEFGRIAAQTAKQVILQKIKEAEREEIYEEYKSKEGEVISGVVQRVERDKVFLDIGRTLGVLPRSEQIPGEFYKPEQRLKIYVLKVEKTSKGPVIFLSRAYPKLVTKLFELEVPEIASGDVEIKRIAREPGFRTKIAVFSNKEGLDPIGACVGQRGTRVMGIINELGGEKIDVIEWSEDPKKFITNALLPAKAVEIKILPKNVALCVVPDDQLSLAIGKDGQNVRLASQLTGWKIDVKTQSDSQEEEAKNKKENNKEEDEIEEDKNEENSKDKEGKKGEKEKKESKESKKLSKTKTKTKTKKDE